MRASWLSVEAAASVRSSGADQQQLSSICSSFCATPPRTSQSDLSTSSFSFTKAESATNLTALERSLSNASENGQFIPSAAYGRSSRALHDSMRYSLLAGGKRVRPILCLAACELMGGHENAAMPCACAIEMIHTLSLVHDDLPYCEKRAREGRVATTGGARAGGGDAQRGVTGDGGRPDSGPGSQRGQRYWCAAGFGCADIHSHAQVSRSAGVRSGGRGHYGRRKDIEALRRYAQTTGLLFQVVDDILDVTQCSAQLGKTAGKDLRSSKATFPKLMGLQQARLYADTLNRKASLELSRFDAAKAAPLLALADYVSCRQN
ncbi:hypothetical protein L7F22_017245 [Adiantum nelumboides]|nr:hypothetical protein [Adiantum nelumboides]